MTSCEVASETIPVRKIAKWPHFSAYENTLRCTGVEALCVNLVVHHHNNLKVS